MDRKEAADLLDNLIGMIEDSGGRDYDTALKMGIEALSAQIDHSGDVNGKVDLIDRQTAIDALVTPRVLDVYDSYWNGRNKQYQEDIDAINALPSAQPDLDEWCYSCSEYDAERHCCPRWNRVIRQTLEDAQPEIIHCGDCEYKDDGIDEDGIQFLKCLHGRSYGGTRINDYCSWAERRTDATTI